MKRFLLVAAFIACALFVAGPASAVTLDADDLIGTVVNGTPSDPASELTYANQLITMYNTSTSPVTIGTNTFTLDAGVNVPAPPLDPALATGAVTVDPPVFPVDLTTTSYDYVYAKFGGFGALFWLGGATSLDGISLDPPSGVQGGGLSHYTFFNPTQVPEGATLMLLGFGLAGVGTLRRFMKL
jgi:hypothetical protein